MTADAATGISIFPTGYNFVVFNFTKILRKGLVILDRLNTQYVIDIAIPASLLYLHLID